MTGQGRRSASILVVEDVEAIRKMVCAILVAHGYKCVEAVDGREALQLVEDGGEPFELVLTDMIMPRMNGAELARNLSRIRPGIPIVYMSGYTEESVIRDVANSGAFLAKPFTASALLETVRRSLDGS
jgi:two-component system cell cycle sensor histidine kinase/response regulator CckA